METSQWKQTNENQDNDDIMIISSPKKKSRSPVEKNKHGKI